MLIVCRCRAEVVPALVDKALGAARAGTKRKATDLCLMFVEVENNGEGVVVRHSASSFRYCADDTDGHSARTGLEATQGCGWSDRCIEGDCRVRRAHGSQRGKLISSGHSAFRQSGTSKPSSKSSRRSLRIPTRTSVPRGHRWPWCCTPTSALDSRRLSQI